MRYLPGDGMTDSGVGLTFLFCLFLKNKQGSEKSMFCFNNLKPAFGLLLLLCLFIGVKTSLSQSAENDCPHVT